MKYLQNPGAKLYQVVGYDEVTQEDEIKTALAEGWTEVSWTPTINNADLLSLCKAQAKELLQATDWSEIPSVSNINNTPHLVNVADFLFYRQALRALVINPVANPIWPTLPVENWL